MAALPKRRISTGRQGRRRQDKVIAPTAGPNRYVGSRARRAAKQGATDESSANK